MKQSTTPPTHTLVGLVAAAILATTVTAACDTTTPPEGPQYLGVCVNQLGYRVPDEQCGLDEFGDAVAAGLAWDYVDVWRYRDYTEPRYGTQINTTNITIIHNTPHGASVSRAVPRTGGAASTIRTNLAHAPAPAPAPKPASSIQRGGFGVPAGASSDSVVSRTTSGS